MNSNMLAACWAFLNGCPQLKFNICTIEFAIIHQNILTYRWPQISPLYIDTELNCRDRVLGEIEKNSFIDLPDKECHSGLMLSKLYVQIWSV